MYAPKHRHFSTGLVVHSEVQHFVQAKAMEKKTRAQDVRMRSKNKVLMVSCMPVQYFMRVGMRK